MMDKAQKQGDPTGMKYAAARTIQNWLTQFWFWHLVKKETGMSGRGPSTFVAHSYLKPCNIVMCWQTVGFKSATFQNVTPCSFFSVFQQL